MKTLYTVLISLTITISVNAQKINIAAAANLKYALDAIRISYNNKYPKSTVNVTYGSSGSLSQQILNGASFDFFLSADTDYPNKLKEKGVTIGDAVVYASGKLVLFSTSIDVTKGLLVLNDASIKKIAVAKPETAPYGNRTIELLKSQGWLDKLSDKIVYADNITQTAQYAFSGNAEIGFIALSLALAPEMTNKGSFYIIDPSLYSPIDQACVKIKTSVVNPETNRFMQFILSPEAKVIWEKYGYNTPSK